jgi:hypothetical protein
MTRQDYPYIRAWGRMMNSTEADVEAQIRRAKKNLAPNDALFYSETLRQWQRFSDMPSGPNRWTIGELAKEFIGENG